MIRRGGDSPPVNLGFVPRKPRLFAAVLTLAVLAGCGGGLGEEPVPEVTIERAESRDHIDGPIDYEIRPPSGGPHNTRG